MSVDSLQRVFKTLTDPTRIRILALLGQEELAVQDLVSVLGLAQSTVSRHLSILRDSGLLRDRREGTYAYYRFIPPLDPEWRGAWELASKALAKDPLEARDRAALDALLRERSVRSRNWFDAIGPEWDNLRTVFNDDVHRARAIARLVPPNLKVADIGTGTGILAQELAGLGVEVIAVDHSRRMLEAAKDKLSDTETSGVELRYGDVTELPISDGEVDAALAHMVLHYVASPTEALREMARIVRVGGRVIVVDFVENDQEWMREELGLLWQGFSAETLREWFQTAGLEEFQVEMQIPETKGSELPATFIATAQKKR
ncbi:MAG: ArsR/SmtB family transcription factor [Planctomycetota bacterium]|jgi:ArsR family transcriptional regulator